MIIPEGATLPEINACLIACANKISEVSTKVAEYKADAALKQTTYKRLLARAKVLNMGAGNATITAAKAETDEDVVQAQDAYDQASALYTVAMGEYEALETTFVALRKLVELQKLEAQGTGYAV